MITVDKEALPKQIKQDDLRGLVGESLYWFCPACRKWRTSPITAEKIICSVCGGAPDWDKHKPTLAYESRYKRVQELCAEGSEWRAEYDKTERRYGDFIEQTYTGLPARTKDIGWRYFSNAWKMVDTVADYLLPAQDSPKMDVPHIYSEDGLRRRYLDSRRKHNVVSLSELTLKSAVDDGGMPLTDQEAVEIKSFRTSDNQRFCDTYFSDEFLNAFNDPLERSIAFDLSRGAKKRDIERCYGLTERRGLRANFVAQQVGISEASFYCFKSGHKLLTQRQLQRLRSYIENYDKKLDGME